MTFCFMFSANRGKWKIIKCQNFVTRHKTAIKTKFRDKNQGINNLISIIKQGKTTHCSVAKDFPNLASFGKRQH